MGGKDWAGPFFPSSKMYWSIYLSFSFKFSNLQVYWYFYFVGWGKTGLAHSFPPGFLPPPPPPPSIMFGSYNLLLSLSVYVTLCMYLNNFEWPIPKRDQVLNQLVNWYFYIVGWGKTGPAHSFPPPKCSDLSIYPLDFWIMLFFCCIWTLLTYQPSRESSFQTNKFIRNCRVGTDWASPFFPPSLIFRSFYWSFRLSVYVTLSLYLNIYVRPIPKRESSF